jgi:hypothetical protein
MPTKTSPGVAVNRTEVRIQTGFPLVRGGEGRVRGLLRLLDSDF